MKLKNYLKVFALLVAAFPATMSGQTSTKLYIEDFNIDPSQTKEVEIMMENPDIEVWQAQLDVRLPEGLSIVKEDGDLIIDLLRNSKRNKHTLEANETEGVVRILVTTTSEATIQGANGPFISMSIKAAADFTSGTIKLEKMKLVPLEGSSVVPEVSECKVALEKATIIDEDGAEYIIEEGNTVSFTGNTNAGSTYSIPGTVTYNGVTYTVTTIASGAFQNNTGLTNITIPGTIVSIGGYALGGCTSMESIDIKANIPPTLYDGDLLAMRRAASSVFAGINKETCKLIVPEGCVEAYKNAYGWGEFVNITDGTTGIHAITVDGKSGNIYDLQGRKVTECQLSRGVYIMDGRKYVVK